MRALLRSLARRAICLVRPRALVLAYHHVASPGRTAPYLTTVPERFGQQMAYLARTRLVVSMDCLLQDLRRQRFPAGGRVVLTFDDAPTDMFTTTLPILRRHQLPATVFVATGLVGQPDAFWWNRLFRLPNAGCSWQSFRMLDESQRRQVLDGAATAPGIGDDGAGAMTWDQLAQLDASGLITLGAHTVTHPVLAALEPGPMLEEVTASRDTLKAYRSFGNVFAYPYGDPAAISAAAIDAVRQAGFAAAFTGTATALAGNEDPMLLGRVCADDLTLDEFRWLIDHYLVTSAKPQAAQVKSAKPQAVEHR